MNAPDIPIDIEAPMTPRIHLRPAAGLVLILLHMSLMASSSLAGGKRADFGTVGPLPSAGTRVDGRGPRAGTNAATIVATSGTIPNVPFSMAPGQQTSEFVMPDGEGGAIVVWQDQREGGSDIFAQRLGNESASLWALDGVPVCKAAGAQDPPQAVSDGAGGAIVVWADARPSGQGRDIYVQRMNAYGTPLWTFDGVQICGAVGDQKAPVIVSDGVGGAIVAWVDERSYNQIYAQRINGSGVVQWAADGVPLNYTLWPREGLAIVSDGLEGAIVAWKDLRGDGVGDIWASRVGGDGATPWSNDGVPVCSATGVQESAALVSDEANGAIVVWKDGRGASPDVYAQRMSDAGVAQWAADGVAVCAATGVQQAPSACGDGAGGALVAWQDKRGASEDIYAQRVDGAGAAVWTANGVGICTAATDQVSPVIAVDPMGGAIVAWTDSRTPANGLDVYAQHVTVAAGAVQWTANGVQVTDAAYGQDTPGLAADGVGGATVVFRDVRSGVAYDLYAQNLTASGQVSNGCTTQTLMSPLIQYFSNGPESYYEVPIVDLNWNAMAVRGTAGSDWDLEFYADNTFGHSEAPICYTNPIGGSYFSSGADLIMGDFNPTHTYALNAGEPGFGLRATRYSGTGKDSVQWDNGAVEVTKETTGSTCGAKQSQTPWRGVVEVWEIVLFANNTYKFDLSTTGNVSMLFFSDAGTTGTYVVPRSERVFELSNGITFYRATVSEVYGIAFVNNTGLGATYCLKVTTQSGSTGVGDGSSIQTGLQGVSPNPSAGRVQFEFALREPGSVGFDVVDMAGRVVARIPERHWEAGTWYTDWDGRRSPRIPAGVYFVQMRVNGERAGRSRLAVIR